MLLVVLLQHIFIIYLLYQLFCYSTILLYLLYQLFCYSTFLLHLMYQLSCYRIDYYFAVSVARWQHHLIYLLYHLFCYNIFLLCLLYQLFYCDVICYDAQLAAAFFALSQACLACAQASLQYNPTRPIPTSLPISSQALVQQNKFWSIDTKKASH